MAEERTGKRSWFSKLVSPREAPEPALSPPPNAEEEIDLGEGQVPLAAAALAIRAQIGRDPVTEADVPIGAIGRTRPDLPAFALPRTHVSDQVEPSGCSSDSQSSAEPATD